MCFVLCGMSPNSVTVTEFGDRLMAMGNFNESLLKVKDTQLCRFLINLYLELISINSILQLFIIFPKSRCFRKKVDIVQLTIIILASLADAFNCIITWAKGMRIE